MTLLLSGLTGCGSSVGMPGDPGATGANGARGADGYSSLFLVSSEPAGAHCPTGGQRIDLGLDDGTSGGIARDGLLQPGEVRRSSYVCNGATGSTGETGALGATGETGAMGAMGATGETGAMGAMGAMGTTGGTGAAGYDSLAAIGMLAPDPGVCPAGGQAVNVGRDDGTPSGTARDGILQASEVEATSVVCNGATGVSGSSGYSTLLQVTPADPGAACPSGGQHLLAGLDDGSNGGTARDGILQASEVTVDRFVCNGADGADGTDSGGSCSSSHGVLDQAQLDNPGWYIGLSPSQEPIGQTFTVGATGKLTGIEIGVHRCGRTDPTGTVELALSDAAGTVLATTSLPVSELDNGCSSGGLNPSAVTQAYFDLGAACLQVTPGMVLSLSMTVENLTGGTCDMNTHRCPNNGRFCFSNRECELFLNVDMNPDTYAAGMMTIRGDDDPSEDMTFKTFVH